ncbi:outer membrane receptor protein involved in Fe transport [Sphingomonas leidyi]|uniref:Outer membrane receptor protein involved in Fe transport n=6 Tax=Pseudomonadota TaxID=1224 RepID=A0A7X5V1K7_9SPHN|nr:TonB-dependent receptor [Sphingomonas leidyi]NIJ66234.1 outer membrane receptor protein involved in Fe transport [Sphingomonas leidyi]
MRYMKLVAVALAGTSMVALPVAAMAQAASGEQSVPATGQEASEGEGQIVVLGSRIPRIQGEGPAPVTTITADDILRSGYQSVPDVLRAITQNGGETQSQQSFSGADFTPGAQQVDLRGLGPNHTLVLVNGRRIADFPLPFKGNGNFTDISNIPVGLIERVEILSGSASAIYGSDAISGVVNFQLKSKPDGTRIDYRYGATEQGGGSSQRLSLTTGWETGGFHGVVGVELLDQRPLWQYQRKLQDSTADDPTGAPLARRTFLRADEYLYYINPGKATCDRLSSLNRGTTYYAARPRRDTISGDGYFCGSNASVAYGTMLSKRQSASGFGTMGYTLSDHAELFLDFQASYSNLKLFRDVLSWSYVAPDGNEEGTFYNPNYLAPGDTDSGDQLDNWTRQFTPEEMGGFDVGMTRNRSFSYNVTPGVKGSFGGTWNYEFSLNHAEYSARISFPQVVISKANAFFLGPQVGVDPNSGYAQFNANPTRLYTPLTPAEYRSITADSIYRPKSWVNNVAATVNNTELFRLPGGPVGFAISAEVGNQGYDLKPDPLALTQYYVGLVDSDGKGTRQHWGAGGELRIPAFSFLELDAAARYDHYSFAGNGFGKFTYNLGAVVRPTKSLMLRSAYGTGFRAPDLNYVFRGPGNTHPSGTDYYLCRRDEPGVALPDCGYADQGIVSHRSGNRRLRPETSTSLNAGIVWQPSRRFDVSVDYFRVAMKNQVLDMNIDSILRDEADCRLGQTAAGSPVDGNSPTCLDAKARVQRYVGGALDGQLQGVFINPINVAKETTDGIDFAAHLRIPTAGIGTFALSASYTYVLNHTIRQYPGDPVIDKLTYDSGYDIPRDKGTASLSWDLGKFSTTLTGQRLGRLPNYDENAFIKESYLFNLSAQYNITDRFRLSGTINNLFDQNPIKDRTYGAYPYYDISWFDGAGRSFYVQLTYKMGGAKL